jgi:hypothetical protein
VTARSGRPAHGRPARRATGAATALTLCGLALAGCTSTGGGPDPAATGGTADGTRPATATAPVVEGDLVDSKKVPGTLGHGPSTPLSSAGTGTVTALPGYGTVVPLDGVLYSVDERPVRALHGDVPIWRPLHQGLRGADVDQLKDSLRVLGHDLVDDDRFDWATAEAVSRWQRDHGMDRTGSLDADDVAFVPGDIRVAEITGRVGDAAGGPVYAYTATTPVATGMVAALDVPRFAVGTTIEVSVPGGATVAGEVVSVGSSGGAGGDQGSGTGSGASPGDDRVTVVVGLGDDPPSDLPSTGSVDLVVAGERRDGVLSVPIPALLAGADGYVVERLGDDGGIDRIGVDVGFVAQGRAEISGEGLTAGDEVVVPS